MVKGLLGMALPGVAVPGIALAGGFEVGVNGALATARGGAFTVRADDVTALAHNPAGLLKLRGTHLQLSHNTVHAPATFTRAVTDIPHGANPAGTDPNAPVSNESPWFALGGLAMASTDFGLENWTFAAGLYGPSASGSQRWPETGGQRYMLTQLDVMLVYYSVAAAWGKRDHYGLGLTLQMAHQPQTNLKLVVDGTTGGDLAPYYNATDVVSEIRLSAPPAFTAIAGGWWRLDDHWELGASGRVVPAYLRGSGDFTLANTTTGSKFSAAQLAVAGSAARLDLVIPPTAQVGVRYRGLDGARERWDLELNAVYEAWSMLQDYKVDLDGTIKLFAAAEAPTVVIAKNWRDTFALRLGGSYHLAELPLSLSAGSFVETGAVPQNYSHLDFTSFNRLGLGAGVTGHFGPLDLQLSYAHVFQEDRTVSEAYGKVYQQRALAMCPDSCKGPGGVRYDGVPANAGKFETAFDFLSVSAVWRFGGSPRNDGRPF
jgi:long-subunit fatty acid transport protein